MVFRRRYTRGRRASLNPIQSYKQVSVDGPASRAAATTIVHTILGGTDDYSGPTGSNSEVPTGAKVMRLLIFAAFTNLVSVSSLLHFNLVCLRSGMTPPTPGAVGGNPTRNTVLMTQMKFLGKDQNSNFMWSVKIPNIYQRIREGDLWQIIYRADAVFASATQVIYKFYR